MANSSVVSASQETASTFAATIFLKCDEGTCAAHSSGLMIYLKIIQNLVQKCFFLIYSLMSKSAWD